jgi:hypothetical protein
MSDLTHALAVSTAGLVMAALGLLMAWHCLRSARRGELQISTGCLVERRQNPGWFRFGIASFALMALALFGAGVFFLGAGLWRL